MQFLGGLLLVAGIIAIVASFAPAAANPMFPIWVGGIGGAMVVLSYILNWKE